MAAPANEFIPQEVADDIFVRLPIKSLIRFQSVSKPFRTSLSDPHFTRLHYHRSKSHKDDTQFLLLSKVKNQAFVIASCPRHNPENPALSMTISNFDFPKKKAPEKVIIGSGDGLFCIYTEKKGIEVWNPTTRERRRLPELGRPSFGGICYDPRIDDYKVVVFFHHNYAVFELKDKCWRISGSCTDGSYTGVDRRAQPTEPINGAIYWMIRNGERWIDIVIYSFDLRKEELTEITPPSDCDWMGELGMGVMHGYLCMVKYKGIWSKADKRWVMKEYGVWSESNFIEEGSMFVDEGYNVFRFVDGSWRGYCLHICNVGYGKPICDQHIRDQNITCHGLAVCSITKVIQFTQSLISPFVTPYV